MKINLFLFYLLNIIILIQSMQVWLPEVKGYSDFAGLYSQAISCLRVSGGLEYRVHTLGGTWLPPVTGNDETDSNNGYAGIEDKPIDGVAIKGATYKVHILGGDWLSEVNQYNINDLDNGMAGILGKKIDAIMIKDRTYAVAIIKNGKQTTKYDRSKAVEYAKQYAFSINHRCGDHLSCTPAAYFGNEHCGYPGDGGDCANFVSQCLVLGGGHQDLSGSDNCRGYPCGWNEPGAKRLGSCLVEKGWTSSCDYLLKPPSNIKAGDVLVYHASHCDDFDAHAVIVTQGGSNPKIACHSNEQLDISYTYMANSKPYYQWIHFNDDK